MHRPWFSLPFVLLLASCSSSSPAPSSTSASDAGTGAQTPPPPPGSVVEHGTIVDYQSLKPVAGLTVTDNGATTTTDADGRWSLNVPADAVLRATVTGPKYAPVLFPDATPYGADVDYGTSVMPDTGSYNLEEGMLAAFDSSKALVHVIVVTSGSCASATGGTISVTAPSTASLSYFNSGGIPGGGASSFQDVQPNRPVAVVYNIDVGADLQVKIDHPTCKQAPWPVTYNGKVYSGKVRTDAAEPGGYNAALVVVLE
jgi:hypothetical protein